MDRGYWRVKGKGGRGEEWVDIGSGGRERRVDVGGKSGGGVVHF